MRTTLDSRALLRRHRIAPWRGLLLGATALLGLGLVQNDALALTQVSSFGSNPGNLAMYKYVPGNAGSSRPLVVALHGCSQSAASYDAETGWVKFADRDKFYLVLPQQKSANNQSGCFNFFEPGDQNRGGGEALSIKQMVDQMKADYSIDPDKVFVTGLSAGGFMTDVMLATYPDVFAGGAPVAGGAYKCATSMNGAFTCMNPGIDKSPSQWGALARSGYSGWNGHKPRVSIWHGASDYTVRPMNQTEQMEQWTDYAGIDRTADVSDTVKGQAHKVYQDGSGAPWVETYSIAGMGHGTPIDPGSAADQCGTAGAYILDVYICSTYFIGRFWGIVADAGTGDGDDDDPPPSELYCGVATNLEHYDAGRAIRNGIPPYENYSATGSYQWLGYAGDSKRLKETSAGYFVVASSCP